MPDNDQTTNSASERSELHGSSATALLADIVQTWNVELFHDPAATPYARFAHDGRTFVTPIDSAYFRRWLSLQLYRETGRAAKPEVLNPALGLLSAQAQFDGPERAVFLRSAPAEPDGFDYWLADADDPVVEVRPGGWGIVPGPDRYFRTNATTQPIPQPESEGDIQLLREYVSPATEADFMLIVAWAMMAMRPAGPYPLLVFQGEQGSGKSTATRILKALLDPVKAPLRAAPRNEHDLVIAAQHNSVLSVDNVSTLTEATSNAFCRLSTGGGYTTRRLYTTDEEAVFEQTRPVLVNGIEGVATRQDLLDRSVVISLPRRTSRKDEASLWTSFALDAPKILGALLDGAVMALKSWASAPPTGTRMADFQRWASAGLPAFGWTADEFQAAYQRNRADALMSSLDGSVLPGLITQLLKKSHGSIEGQPAHVYDCLAIALDDSDRRARTFPRTAQSMSRQLKLLAPALAQIGIDIEHGHRGSGAERSRYLRISRIQPWDPALERDGE